MSELSPLELKRARRRYNAFNMLNSLSFLSLSGSVVTLFSLRMGASSSFVGLLNSFGYFTYFAMLVGERLVRKRRIVSVFSRGWFLRNVVMIPVLAAPALFAAGRGGAALAVVLLCSAGFNYFRGVGLIGNNPVLGVVAGGRDRGSYMVQIQIINSLSAILGSVAVAVALGKDAAVGLYLVFIAVGIAVGMASSWFLSRIPEPEGFKPPEGSSLVRTARAAFSRAPFRRFMTVFIALAFVAGADRAFLIVYTKEVYGQGDSMIIAFTIAGALGTLAMGLLTRLVVDRMGAKPLYVLFAGVTALALVPVIVSPPLAPFLPTILFLYLTHFLSGVGLSGEENAAQTYFFAITPPGEMLDLAVVYFLVYGAAGSLGSLAGGVFIDAATAAGLSAASVYRTLFGLLFAVVVAAMIVQSRLARLGGFSTRRSLGIIFSLRGLHAMALMNRLDRARLPGEERALIRALGRSGSPLPTDELLVHLSSPRLQVRMDALAAIENLSSLPRSAEDALIAEARGRLYTTAYLAARILGKSGSPRAAAALRSLLASEDYMLAGEAMVALARLGDTSCIPEIEAVLAESTNPRLVIMAATALETLRNVSSVPVFLDILRRKDPPAFLQDEIVLAVAGILGMGERFHQPYRSFLENQAGAAAVLGDLLEETREKVSIPDLALGRFRIHAEGAHREGESPEAGEGIELAVGRLFSDPPDGSALGSLLYRCYSRSGSIGIQIMAEACMEPPLLRFAGFRFLLGACAILSSAPLSTRPTHRL